MISKQKRPVNLSSLSLEMQMIAILLLIVANSNINNIECVFSKGRQGMSLPDNTNVKTSSVPVLAEKEIADLCEKFDI